MEGGGGEEKGGDGRVEEGRGGEGMEKGKAMVNYNKKGREKSVANFRGSLTLRADVPWFPMKWFVPLKSRGA